MNVSFDWTFTEYDEEDNEISVPATVELEVDTFTEHGTERFEIISIESVELLDDSQECFKEEIEADVERFISDGTFDDVVSAKVYDQLTNPRRFHEYD